jgi:hypothetical protein
VAGFTRDMDRMMAHRASIAFAEWMNGIEFVDMVAETVEKLVARKTPKTIFRGHIREQLVHFAGDIGVRRNWNRPWQW